MSKGPNAFRTISETSDELGVPQHVLRFWETKFSFVKPMKRAGGRRFYRPQDIVVLKGVKTLLYGQGYKIEGVQKLFRDQGMKALTAAGDPTGSVPMTSDDSFEAPAGAPTQGGLDAGTRARLQRTLKELESAKAKLDSLLSASRA